MSYFLDELHNELDDTQELNLAENINVIDEHNVFSYKLTYLFIKL